MNIPAALWWRPISQLPGESTSEFRLRVLKKTEDGVEQIELDYDIK
ncbi:MAG: hypothetical protein ABFD66_11540 [Smithella sp.]